MTSPNHQALLAGYRSSTRPVAALDRGALPPWSPADQPCLATQRATADAQRMAAQELLVAVFRLAVEDLEKQAGSDPNDILGRRREAIEAALFITSEWATELADIGLIPLAEVRRRLRASTTAALLQAPWGGVKRSADYGTTR
jgi:hypothetical protein